MDTNLTPMPVGRKGLLDAAEQLFARKGYDGASMREITRMAGVELGLASYHFQNKDEMFRQVLLRRVPEMSAALGTALDSALGCATPPTVEAVLWAYLEPHLEGIRSSDPGRRHYMRLAAHTTLLAGRPELTEPVSLAYRPIMQRFENALAAAAPVVHPDDLHRTSYLFRLTILSVVIDGTPAEIERPETIDPDELGASIVRIFAAGLRETNSDLALSCARG